MVVDFPEPAQASTTTLHPDEICVQMANCSSDGVRFGNVFNVLGDFGVLGARLVAIFVGGGSIVERFLEHIDKMLLYVFYDVCLPFFPGLPIW